MNKLVPLMRRALGTVLGAVVLLFPLTPQAQVEIDTDRNGSDYANFALPTPDPQQCMARCQGDNSCRAWTYVKPGVQGPAARCYLKNPAPPATRNDCCISGTVSRIVDQRTRFEVNTDRNGSDYARFELPSANPDLCFDRCRGDTRCAAWTFVRPGVQGPAAVCYLKDPAPPPTANSCCVSGSMGRSPALPPPPTAPVQLPGGGVRYDNPAVNGILVDHCVSWGTNCGNGGADQFCRLQGQGSALSFQVSNPGRTYVLGDRRVCEGGNCVGFTQVVCAGAGQVAPPPPLIYPPVNPPPPPPGPPPAVAGVTWYTSAKAQVGSPDGQRFSFNCPPVGPDGFLSIWGSDVYTYDSGICLAGAHVGVITRERGGVVTIEMRPGLSSYPASVRNGVSSQGYGAYNKSFAVVSGTGYRIAPPVSSLPVQPPSPLTPPPPPPVIPGSTTTPFFPATAQAAQFLGCFKDPNNPFDLDGYLERSRQNTPQRCVQVCASRGFKYAGVQFAESCLCGNSYGRFGQAANCNMACTGDGRQVCGGSNANSVYSTGQ